MPQVFGMIVHAYGALPSARMTSGELGVRADVTEASRPLLCCAS